MHRIIIALSTRFFFLNIYEAKDDAKPSWAFKFDVVDGIRGLGLRIPIYDTEERSEYLIRPKQIPVTGYRILVSASATSFGITKALLSYRGLKTAPTTVEWVYGVVLTVRYGLLSYSSDYLTYSCVSLYWLGMYENSSSEVVPWLFVADYSKQGNAVSK